MKWTKVIKARLIKDIVRRDGRNCRYCGYPFSKDSPPTIDHIVPRSEYLDDDIDNLQLLHHICNLRKRGRKMKVMDHKVEPCVHLVEIRHGSLHLSKSLEALKLKILHQALLESPNVSMAAKKMSVERIGLYRLLWKYHLSTNGNDWEIQEIIEA